MAPDRHYLIPLMERRAPIIAAIAFFFVSFHVFTAMYVAAPDPYMDEEFHVPQALKYCEGNFSEWDPKLTTLPGLYFVSLAVWKSISTLVPVVNPCRLWNLRFTNLFFAVGGLLLFFVIFREFNQGSDIPLAKSTISAVNLATFPVLYFFTFLYYTDQASTFFVFLMTLFHLRNQRLMAGLAGGLAVFTRQTNIVWVVFLALLELFKTYKIIMGNLMKKGDLRKICVDEDLQVVFAPFVSLKRLPTSGNLKRILGYFAGVALEGVPRIWAYLSITIGFAVFVVVNKGIVVGDRTAHEAVLHIPQLFYFSLFSLVFASPYLCTPSKFRRFFRDCRGSPLVACLILKAILLATRYFTYAHQYLISDNRHYTFYIWKRVFERNPSVKYLLAPVYLYGMWAIFDELRPYKGSRSALFFMITAATLVPQKLLEFRYFILPFLFFRLHVQKASIWQLAFETAMYQLVNATTIYMFINRPFVWATTENIQHFMW